MRYKIFFHCGNELALNTRVARGYAWIDDAGLHIEGPGGLVVPTTDLQSADLFRLHGLGRVIRIDHQHGRIFVAVVRLMIGQFAVINFFKTGRLQREIAGLATHARQ